MRTVNMIIGALFVIAGVVMIAGFSGITFLSVAFVLGILFMAAGIFGCLSYRSYREDSVDKTWVLVDGMTTFVLGFLMRFVFDSTSACSAALSTCKCLTKFLFVGPKVCLGLLSDSTSRWTPLPSAMGLSLPTALGTFTR